MASKNEVKRTEPIRILQEVAGLGNGGMETFLMNVYRNIDRSKVQFDFVLSHDWKTNLYEEEIKALGGKIFYLREGYKQFFSFYKFLKHHPEYKIVHSHRGTFGAFYLLVAWIAGVKHRIVHSHTANADNRIKACAVAMLRPFLNLVSTKRFSCGQQAGTWMFGNSKFEIINNAIDISAFRHFDFRKSKRNQLGVEDDELLLGHVGRFEAVKNHSFLIDVFNEIHRKRPKSKLLLIGDGNLRKHMEKKVNDLGLIECVIFLQNRKDVNELLIAIDFVLFPSLYEGFSFAMVEMQAASLRILASDSIPPEINITGEVYFKSIDDSAAQWADRAIELVNYDRSRVDIKALFDHGLDIQANVENLQRFYVNCAARN